jgi:hypothetical protein
LHWHGKGSSGRETRIRCRSSKVWTWHNWARMGVLTFIGGHNYAWITERPLDSLLDITWGSGATIVTPKSNTHGQCKPIKIWTKIYPNLQSNSKESKKARRIEFTLELVPRKGAVFHSFLAVLSPSVPIFQMINLALCHECESRLSLSLLICLLWFQPGKQSTKPTHKLEEP